MFYLSLIYLIAFLFLGEKIPKKYRFVTATIPFLFIIFLRFGVGADYFAYGEIYYRMDPSNLNNSLKIFPDVELLYRWLNLFARFFGVPYHLFVGILSSVLMFITLKWLEAFDDNFELSVLLYFTMFFFVWNLSAMRQGISIAVLLYLFFNSKKEYSITVKLIASIVMFFVHASSIIVFVLYIISSLKWTKKTLLIALVASIFMNFLPISTLAAYLENIPYLNKILYYIDPVHLSIFSFSALMRFFFFGIVFIHYDDLTRESNLSYKLINFTLLSFISYFFLMFSSLLASRVSVYGYILMVVIIPAILATYPSQKVKRVLFASVFAFSLFSFYKELSAMVDQTEYKYSMHQLNFETVFSSNYNNFNKGYAFAANMRAMNDKETDLDVRVNQKHEKVEAEVREGDTYLSVFFPEEGSFGIINQRGEIVELPSAEVRTKTYLDMVEIIFNPKEFPTIMYRNIGTDTILGFWEMLPFAAERSERDLYFNVHWTYKHPYEVSDLEKTTLGDFVNIGAIQSASLATNDFYPQFSYLNVFTSVSNYIVLLNEDGSLKLDRIFNSVEQYNVDKIAIGYSHNSRYFINEWGEIIWKESIEIPMCRTCQ